MHTLGPNGVLNVDKSSTVCYGWALSQGRNCRNPISHASRQQAASILSTLTTIDPSSDLRPRLQTLARLLLCKRNHQNQAGSVVARWKEEMDDFLRNAREEEDEEMRGVEAELAELRRRQRQPERRDGISEVSEVAHRTAGLSEQINRLEVEAARILESLTRLEESFRQLKAGSVIADLSPPDAPRTAAPSLHDNHRGRSPPRPLAGRVRQSAAPVSTLSSAPEVQLSAPRETSNSPDDSGTVDTLFDHLGTSRSQYRQWLEERGLPESATPETPPSIYRETFDSLDESGSADMIFEVLGTSRSQIRRELEERERVEQARRPLIRPGSGFQTWAEYVNWRPRPPPGFQTWEEYVNRTPRRPSRIYNPIAPLPFQLRPLKQPKPPQDCSICYEELQDGKSLVSCKVQCKQRFHEECMKTWFQNSEKRTCPYW